MPDNRVGDLQFQLCLLETHSFIVKMDGRWVEINSDNQTITASFHALI